MPLNLNVPYSEKDLAKARGAFWNPELKTWYVPDTKYSELTHFEKWLPVNDVDLILPRDLVIALTARICWKCNHNNQVIAIGANSFYEKGFNDEENKQIWDKHDFFTLFQNIKIISGSLLHILTEQYPNYKLGYSKTVGGKYWSNHCSQCKAIQGDWFLFDEPGSAFTPLSPQEASRISLKKIHLPFDTMINGTFSLGDHLDLIQDYAVTSL
ncbi:DUF5710 domain-containing protein [Longitalea arenae]|uniref:DUF5710 domain-containing protein n=1 Tax=Longitalea arenae TaxID=2812558 RepID=UPI001966F5F7|nr:DUF5710 domain-containing protein [Longitalea arenae]